MYYMATDNRVNMHETGRKRHMIIVSGNSGYGKSSSINMMTDMIHFEYVEYMYNNKWYDRLRGVDTKARGIMTAGNQKVLIGISGSGESRLQIYNNFMTISNMRKAKTGGMFGDGTTLDFDVFVMGVRAEFLYDALQIADRYGYLPIITSPYYNSVSRAPLTLSGHDLNRLYAGHLYSLLMLLL